MADNKIKQKQEELIKMVSEFSDEYLDEEYKLLNIKLVEKLGRKHDPPFKRGKLENWASGIVYTIAQLNFLFDNSFYPYITADDICDFFMTKKSTAANKARDIRKLLNLKLGNEEFSTQLVLDSDISRLGGNIRQVKTLEGAIINSELRKLGDMKRQIEIGNEKLDLESIIHEIRKSTGKQFNHDLKRLYWAFREWKFIASEFKDKKKYVTYDDKIVALPIFTSQEKYDKVLNEKSKEWTFVELALLLSDKILDGIVINPEIDDFFLTRNMVFNAILH